MQIGEDAAMMCITTTASPKWKQNKLFLIQLLYHKLWGYHLVSNSTWAETRNLPGFCVICTTKDVKLIDLPWALRSNADTSCLSEIRGNRCNTSRLSYLLTTPVSTDLSVTVTVGYWKHQHMVCCSYPSLMLTNNERKPVQCVYVGRRRHRGCSIHWSGSHKLVSLLRCRVRRETDRNLSWSAFQRPF